MEKRELESLIKKKKETKTVVVSIRLDDTLLMKLKAKGLDISATVRAILERLADK